MMADGRDLHELHALMAPRPFLVSGGSEDQPERWKALNHAVAVNKLLGVENRVGDDQPQGALADRGVERATLRVLRVGPQAGEVSMGSSPHRRTFLQATVGTAALTATTYGRISGANERIGVGFVGYGLMAKKHVATFRAAAGCDVVAVSETHRGRLEEGIAAAGGEGKAAAYPDFRKLLDDKAVDAVVVSTPDHWHALMTMMACAAGKDVYVEKPLTLFVREGGGCQTVAAKHKRVVQVGTQQRSGPHYQRARELIREGHIGKVVSVRMTACRNIMPGFGSPPDRRPARRARLRPLARPGPGRASTTRTAASTTSAGSGTTPAGR